MSSGIFWNEQGMCVCRCQDREQDTGGREEGPASLLPGPWDGEPGSEGITGTVSSLQQINQQINFRRPAGCPLKSCRPTRLPVPLCSRAGKARLSFSSWSCQRAELGGWGAQSELSRRPGGQEVACTAAGCQESKEPGRCGVVCVCTHQCLHLYLFSCVCISVGASVCLCVHMCALCVWVYMCAGGG